MSSFLYVPFTLQGTVEGDFVGILQIGPHRDTVSQSGHLNAQGTKQARDVHGGGFPFNVGIGGHDDLLDVILPDAIQQLLELDLIGVMPLRGDSTP